MIVREDGSALNSPARLGGILLDRADFEVLILDIPRIPAKELDGLIRYRLRSLYPANPRDTAFDYRVESDGSRRQVVVFVSRLAVLERYRSAADGRPLLLPYSLIRRAGRIQRDCRIWFCRPEWAELSIFRAGLLASCTLVHWQKDAPFDLLRAEENVPPEAQGLPVLVIASNSDLLRLRTGKAGKENKEVRFLSFDDLAAAQRKVDGLFIDRKRPLSVLPPAVRIIGLSIVVSLLAVLLTFKLVWQAEGSAANLKKAHALLERQSRDALAAQESVDELSAELSKIDAKKPQDTYRLLSELSRVLGSNVQIQSLEIQGDAFRIEAVGSNPLRSMEGFRDNRFFSGIKLSQVVPAAHSGEERFSFSGVSRVR
ncbi:MAG: hypothetical protein ABSG21_11185 [Spirochaetia bacterium]